MVVAITTDTERILEIHTRLEIGLRAGHMRRLDAVHPSQKL
jgi:hypothetical protein